MNMKTETRNFIVDFLSKELVGPSSEEEALDAGDPPRRRYGAGILFPGSAQVLSHEETAEDEKAVADEISPDDYTDDPKMPEPVTANTR